MIKKLRRNFIIVTMLSVFIVLAVIVATINAANYLNSDSEADALLAMLADNDGHFGTNDDRENNSPPPAMSDENGEPPAMPDERQMPDGPADDRSRRWNNGRFGGREIFTEETPYETRYFSVIIADDGSPVNIDTGRIAAVNSDAALSMARELHTSGRTTGYSGTYKYLARTVYDGTMYIFVDRTLSLRSVTDFLKISLLVSLGAAVAVFVLVFIFSGIIIRPMAESYDKQKKFITNAGHELKTPLAVINSCTEVIELENGESKWTKGITGQTKRLAELTTELVALARMDEGVANLNTEEFDLSETVSEMLDPFMLMAEQKGQMFAADIKPDIMFRGDKAAIAKLCSIMADNAVKYTPENGTIRFSLNRKGKHIIFSSENTAEGVEKGAHPELFDRFHRGDTSHSSEVAGYGIGLSMAQSVVAAHGGRIDAYSKDGSTLTITAKF